VIMPQAHRQAADDQIADYSFPADRSWPVTEARRIPVRRVVGRQSALRAGAVSAHYLPSLGNEPRDAVSGVAHGF
jgi:hypothetical protein